MADLTKVYTGQVRNLGVDIKSRVHSSRLQNGLLAYFPDIQEYNQRTENKLAFKDYKGPDRQRG